MADEAVMLYEEGLPVPKTCADGTGINKGALLILTDPDTVATTTGDTDAIIGVAAEEKIASNGMTSIGVYETGTFVGTAGVAGVTAGQAIISDTATSSANRLVNADVNSEHIVGIALETATSGQTFRFKLAPVSVNLA